MDFAITSPAHSGNRAVGIVCVCVLKFSDKGIQPSFPLFFREVQIGRELVVMTRTNDSLL